MAPHLAIDELAPRVEGVSAPIVTQIAAEDKVKWYKKPNLRLMYLCLFACCMGVEITSGFDSQLINTMQFTPYWSKCTMFLLLSDTKLTFPDFSDRKDATGEPVLSPGMLGFLSASYQLGSIIGVPIAPYVNQRFGRRVPILAGSIIMVVGAIIQGFSQNRELSSMNNIDILSLTLPSWDVPLRSYGTRFWNNFLHQ